MSEKGFYLVNIIVLAAFLVLQVFTCSAPGFAEVTYRDIAGSISGSLKGGEVFENVAGFVLTVAVFGLVFLIFRRSLMRKERELGQRRTITLRSLGGKQKRSWFRLKTNSDFEWIRSAEALKAKRQQYRRDRLVDISGGGLCFRTAAGIEPGEELEMFLDVGEGKPLCLKGRVLRVEEEAGKGYTANRVSVQFENIRGGERDRVVSFIMKRQREAIPQKDI